MDGVGAAPLLLVPSCFQGNSSVFSLQRPRVVRCVCSSALSLIFLIKRFRQTPRSSLGLPWDFGAEQMGLIPGRT